MQSNNNQSNSLHVSNQLPEDPATHALLADISLQILAMCGSSFIDKFAKAAGKAIGADMLLVSRVKSKHIPVETYALYDKAGKTEHYSYPISGTPCEVVIDKARSLTIHEKVATCFPEDTDLVEFGLHSYIGTPLITEDGETVGLIAALWGSARNDLSLEIKALEYFAPLITNDMMQLEATARHELSVAGASSGAWYTDFESDLEYFSDAARRVIGRADLPAKSKRKTLLNLMPPEEQRLMRAAFDAYRCGDAPFDFNFRITSPDGNQKWLRMTGKGQHNAEGRMTAMAGDISDISELVEAKRKAEAASRAKSDFLATMSHEIRTPMNGVLSMAGMLARANLPKEHKRKAEVIQKSGEAMMVILNDVLDLSKIEAGKLDLEKRQYSPRELVEDVSMLWRDTIEQKGIQFDLQIVEPIPELTIGDDTRLRQVLTNLLSNALKFTADGTITLCISAEKVDGNPALKFTVTDTGIGIAKAQQKNLFNAFDQANNSIARRFGGTGLGLAISDKIVRHMGGHFDIVSEPSNGSSFSFTIQSDVVERTNKSEKTAPTGTQTDDLTSPAQQRAILIADDNEINRSVLKAFLSKLPVSLVFVENGAEAVERAAQQHFDVILMDIQMPILDGIGATQKIRKSDGPCRNTPIIALTANAMPGDRRRYLDIGMTGYVSKPIDPKALFLALKEAKPLETKDAPNAAQVKSA